MLSGYKTYIIAASLGVVAAAKYLGYLDPSTADTLSGVLTGGVLMALRAGVKKAG